MVASRGGDEDPEAVSCVGPTSKLLPQLRNVNTLRLTILLPYNTPAEIEATTDGSTASSLVNNWRLLYFPEYNLHPPPP